MLSVNWSIGEQWPNTEAISGEIERGTCAPDGPAAARCWHYPAISLPSPAPSLTPSPPPLLPHSHPFLAPQSIGPRVWSTPPPRIAWQTTRHCYWGETVIHLVFSFLAGAHAWTQLVISAYIYSLHMHELNNTTSQCICLYSLHMHELNNTTSQCICLYSLHMHELNTTSYLPSLHMHALKIQLVISA